MPDSHPVFCTRYSAPLSQLRTSSLKDVLPSLHLHGFQLKRAGGAVANVHKTFIYAQFIHVVCQRFSQAASGVDRLASEWKHNGSQQQQAQHQHERCTEFSLAQRDTGPHTLSKTHVHVHTFSSE
ncbi:hypothetical protein NLJ89_g11130 [Agrocybe chaxingu]|uniref:Uncharacterized protein n=1 Tax=Agrocybe chaxingu TaxID=84603 RepID=A0A9W8JWV4_9AGAR|nr:hypothetical protein NLJ89_g11130 [Agrocybe chaxingu]